MFFMPSIGTLINRAKIPPAIIGRTRLIIFPAKFRTSGKLINAAKRTTPVTVTNKFCFVFFSIFFSFLLLSI